MIIAGKPMQNVSKAYGDQNQVTKNSKVGKNQSAQGKDEFILSSGAQEFGPNLNSIRNASDVRPEKVNEFSGKINDGTYQVDSKGVAEKMLGNYTG